MNLFCTVICIVTTLSKTECVMPPDSENITHTLRYQFGALNWLYVESPSKICLWILLACTAKIAFNVSKRFASFFPETCLLIVLGLIVGAILFGSNADKKLFTLDSETFFLFLLPPIIFDAGYFMQKKAFFEHFGSILTFAVIGTLFNALTIGVSLWAVGLTGLYSAPTPFIHILLFTSLISAVDPITVLAVFEEMRVNQVLFIIVFGESLLNDAISVVLYKMVEGFSSIGIENILSTDVITGIASFFVLGVGGVLIGLLWAVIAAFVTRYTKHVAIMEPVLIFLFAYCSYLTAEFFYCSGILAITFSGIVMKQYVEANMSEKSTTTVKYFLKTLSSSTETIIFMFMGLSVIGSSHHWDTAFVAFTLLFCTIYRAIGTILLSFCLNTFSMHEIDRADQAIMAYGGFRGPIAYALVMALPEDLIPAKKMFVTSCFVVIYFTVFLQGMTVKPLLNFLKVRKEVVHDKTLNKEIFNRFAHHLTIGIESILLDDGENSRLNKFENFNVKYLKKVLTKEKPTNKNLKIIDTFNKIKLADFTNLKYMGKTEYPLPLFTIISNNVNEV